MAASLSRPLAGTLAAALHMADRFFPEKHANALEEASAFMRTAVRSARMAKFRALSKSRAARASSISQAASRSIPFILFIPNLTASASIAEDASVASQMLAQTSLAELPRGDAEHLGPQTSNCKIQLAGCSKAQLARNAAG